MVELAPFREDPDERQLRRTPLHALHLELGAKMVPFAGYDMPVQYPLGVMKEHLHTRAAAGLFDVSHMGQVIVRAEGGYDAAALTSRRLCRSMSLGSETGVSATGSLPTRRAGSTMI